jgi:diguanylate cyclase
MDDARQRTIAGDCDADVRLTRIGGEFCSPALEAIFCADRLDETFRHARILMIGSAILNTLFFVSDWRFHGTPHFYVAIPARAIVVLLALICLGLVQRCRGTREIGAVMVAWMSLNALAVGALVSSHSDIALFVVIMLPLIYYLVVPVSFRWTLGCGAACSVVMLAGYGTQRESLVIELGLILAMLMLNVALAISAARTNRLERRQWLATREQRRIAVELERSRAHIERLFAASPVPMVAISGIGGVVLHINESALALIGTSREDILNTTMTRFYANAEDQRRLGALLARDGAVTDFEVEVVTAFGEHRTVLLKTSMVDTHDGTVALAGIIDISDRKAFERRLAELAATDPLTGLPNRLSFFAKGRVEMMRAARSGQPLTLLMIDLDHFKAVNDNHGHQMGDMVLKAFAGLCASQLRAGDLVGRIGGEEFGVLLPNTDIAAAICFAERMRAALIELRLPAAPELRLTASFGVSTVHPHEADLDQALGRADLALYAAKRTGRNRVECWAEPEARRGMR